MSEHLKIIPDETVGVIKITENTQFNKVRADKVIVNQNVTARIFGSVKTIVLKRGARLFLHGSIFGTVENKGGEIFVFSK